MKNDHNEAVLKWGLVGCGDVAEHKGGPALLNAKGSSLVAVMSRSKIRAEDFAERHNARRCYTAYKDILDDPEVNAIYIATPPYLHMEQTLAAAKAGKHVMCEKPMALNLYQCDRMIQASEENQVQLMIAYYRRRFPAVAKIKALLNEQAIGQVTKIRTEVAGLYHPPEDGSVPWRLDANIAGGGFLWDVGCHRLDLMIYFLGKVTEVCAFLDTVAFDMSVEDSASLLLRFANGVHGLASYHWNVQDGGDMIEIAGTKGRILCDMEIGNVELKTSQGKQDWLLSPPSITHLGIVEDMVMAVQDNHINCIDGHQGRKTNAVLEAAVRSNKENKVITLY